MTENPRHSHEMDFMAPLGLMLPFTVKDVKQAYFTKAKTAHPDAAGDVEEFKQLHDAYQKAVQYAQSHGMAWLSSWVERYVAQQRLIDKVRRLGGYVDIERRDWLKREVGEDFTPIFDKVVGIHLHGPGINDQVLGELVKAHPALTGLSMLDLAGSHVTYRGLETLQRLPKLHRLCLHGTRISWWQRFKLRWTFPNLRLVASRVSVRSEKSSASGTMTSSTGLSFHAPFIRGSGSPCAG